MLRSLGTLTVLMLLLSGCDSSGAPTAAVERRALDHEAPAGEALIVAPWGEGEGAYGRELVGAQTGPMAIAVDTEGDLWIVDTVGAHLDHYDRSGALVERIDTGVHTVDDLALGEDGAAHLLAYQRTPEPGHVVITRDRDGRLSPVRPVPQEVNLPTAIWVDGTGALVEQRHGALHSLDGSGRRWGRPVGELELRLRRTDAGEVLLEARERQGQTRWQRELTFPEPITEILALEAAGDQVVVVARAIRDASAGGGQQSWAVWLDVDGAERGRREVRDARITDAARPYALDRDGRLYELNTDDRGVAVDTYELGGQR